MMLMMLAKGASIISIIGGPFLHFWPFTQNSLGALRLVFKTARVHDARVPGTPKMHQKSIRAVGIRCWSACEVWSGLGMGSGRGPGEKRRSDTGKKVGGVGATPYRGKPLGGTGSALDHGRQGRISGLAAGAGPAALRQPAKSQHHEHDGVCLGA